MIKALFSSVVFLTAIVSSVAQETIPVSKACVSGTKCCISQRIADLGWPGFEWESSPRSLRTEPRVLQGQVGIWLPFGSYTEFQYHSSWKGWALTFGISSHEITTSLLLIRNNTPQTYMPAAEKIPPELWTRIAKFSKRQDLRALSLVSYVTLHSTRIVLFEAITIRQYSYHTNLVPVKLLERVPSLRTAVRRLSLVTSYRTGKPWISFDLLRSLINLECLVLEGWPVGPEDTPALLKVLGECKTLDSFQYFRSLEGETLNLRNVDVSLLSELKRVALSDLHSLDKTIPLVYASQSTLTTLQLLETVSWWKRGAIITFMSRKPIFPHLARLELGSFEDDEGQHLPFGTSVVSLRISLTLFLRANPSIEHLRLDFHNGDNPNVTLLFDPDDFGEDFLPKLKVLDAHFDVASLMTGCGVKSMLKLEELRTGDMTKLKAENVLDAERMNARRVSKVLEAFQRFQIILYDYGGLPKVRDLTLTLGEVFTSGRVPFTEEDVDVMLDCLPKLERWRGFDPHERPLVVEDDAIVEGAEPVST
ncbi:hypothetical protein BJ165DRAFT_1591445 [Panaeolus papilionaceus]|nr:hypothetical protein BJ165DRAFT_1591445 [Panaeolus papilionaceus]